MRGYTNGNPQEALSALCAGVEDDGLDAFRGLSVPYLAPTSIRGTLVTIQVSIGVR